MLKEHPMKIKESRESITLINENEKIFGIYHKPLLREEKKIPAIIICHGFAGQKTGRFRLYVILAEALAKKGIAVLRFDFRGCGDSEGNFIETTFFGEVSDALKALEFLKNDPDIDSERIGIFGRSLGGAVALLAAKSFKNIKSIALFAPMFTPEVWREKWEKAKSSDEPIVMDGQPVGKTFLNQLFELHLEKDLKELQAIPLLHINAEKDSVVTKEHQQSYRAARKGASAISKFIELPNSCHEFSDVNERMFALKETVDFFHNSLCL